MRTTRRELAEHFGIRRSAIEGSRELCDAIPGLIGPALPGIRVTAEVGDIFGRDKSYLVDADVPTVVYFGGHDRKSG